MDMHLERVIQEIRNERLRQDVLWGGPDHDDAQPLSYYLEAIDQKLCRKAMMNLVEEDLADARRRFIQIATLAVAAVESLDRRTLG